MTGPESTGPESPRPERLLTGWLPMSLGILAIVVGGLWTLQGLDVVTGSRMSDVQFWAIVGPVVAVTGLILVVIGVRLRTRAKRESLIP